MSGTHPNDLQRIAQKHGWKPGPLTYAQVRRMGMQEYEYMAAFNKAELDKALDSPRVQAETKRNAEQARIDRAWSDEGTEEDHKEAMREAVHFCAAHPQFRKDIESNRTALVAFLRERRLAPNQPNFALAFQSLAREGRLILNPSAIGVGTETEIGGSRLKHHPELWRLLEPAPNTEQKAKIAEQKMSSKEFREAHKEDFRETRISDRQRASWNKNIAFFLESRPDCKSSAENLQQIGAFITANGLDFNPQGLEAAYKYLKAKNELELNTGAVQEGQTLRYTNLAGTGGDVRNGFVANDTNLASRIASMTADEYSRWLQSPSNRKAADNLAAGVR